MWPTALVVITDIRSASITLGNTIEGHTLRFVATNAVRIKISEEKALITRHFPIDVQEGLLL